MRKTYIILLLLLSLGLSACKAEEPYQVDCDRFPTHADCLVDPDPDPTVCEDGYVLVDNECELDVIVSDPCPEDYILVDDACVWDDTDLGDYLDIFYLNDFHGALERDRDQLGIAYIANLVNVRKELTPERVLFLAGGDMLQGSALSNYYEGLSTINLLNESSLDAFTIGNHEFDWGLETILDYADGVEENGEADFPFLGANIFQQVDDSIPEGIEPYTVIERGDQRIGIIGTMGYGLEYSIATRRIEEYYFGDPVTEIANYSEYLRTELDCDIVLVMAHDSGGSINTAVAALTGDQRVDAIFNAHSHNRYVNESNGVPIIQSGSSGEYVGFVRLFLTDGTVTSYEATNLDRGDEPLLNTADTVVESTLMQYQEETDVLFNDPIITSLASYSSSDLSRWLTKLMRTALDADIAFQNYGGTRTDVDQDEVITLGKLYAIWPFDNVIKTVELDGSIINNIMSNYAYDTEVETFEAGTLYRVATNDYVFDKPENPFLDGTNPENTGILLRDLVEVELNAQADVFTGFLTSNAIQTVPERPLGPEDFTSVFPTLDPLIVAIQTVTDDSFGDTGIDVLYVLRENSAIIGYVYDVHFQGFASTVTYRIGVDASNVVTGFEILSQNETPGYGAQIAIPDNWVQLIGRDIADTDSDKVDGLAGATTTTLTWEASLARVFEYHRTTVGNTNAGLFQPTWLIAIQKEEDDFLFFSSPYRTRHTRFDRPFSIRSCIFLVVS